MIHAELQKQGDGKICPMAIIIKDGQILRGLRNYTKDKWKDISVWTIPGGRSDIGETIEQALRREVYEEIGVDDLNIKDIIGYAPGVQNDDSIVFYHCETNQEPRLMEPEKFSEWNWTPISEYLNETEDFNPKGKEVISIYLKRIYSL